MKDFNDLSGTWTGLSTQDGIRISEAIKLTIAAGHIIGTGSDMDGEFELSGSYSPRNQAVRITRRYTHTAEPSQLGVGIPYDYDGVWDGAMVSGRWHPRSNPHYGGPFEMWPSREEDERELRIEIAELAVSGRA
jgi:hypothetical protein